MFKKLMRKLFSEKGQSLVETALIIALVSIVAIGALTATGTSVNGMFCNVAEQLGGEGGGGGGADPTDPTYLTETLTAAGIFATVNGEGDTVWIKSGTNLEWDTVNTIDRTGVSNSEIDLVGKTNTDWMLNPENTNLGTTEGTIWKFCQDVRTATEDDKWYIPSAGELKARYDAGDAFRPGSVWSSSEESKGFPGGNANYLYTDSNLYSGSKTQANKSVVLFRAP